MSDTVIQQDPELTMAADAFLAEMEIGTYGVVNGIPIWTSCSIRQAFERGAAWEQQRHEA